MEHLNKLVKVSTEGLGANIYEKAIKRVAKAMGALAKTTESFHSEVGVASPSVKHSEESQLRDLKNITQQQLECDSFNRTGQRYLLSFQGIVKNVMKKV